MPTIKEWNKYGRSNCCCAHSIGLANKEEAWGECLKCGRDSNNHICYKSYLLESLEFYLKPLFILCLVLLFFLIFFSN